MAGLVERAPAHETRSHQRLIAGARGCCGRVGVAHRMRITDGDARRRSIQAAVVRSIRDRAGEDTPKLDGRLHGYHLPSLPL